MAGLLVIGLQLPIIGWITEYLISPLFLVEYTIQGIVLYDFRYRTLADQY